MTLTEEQHTTATLKRVVSILTEFGMPPEGEVDQFEWLLDRLTAADALETAERQRDEAVEALRFYAEPTNYRGKFIAGGRTPHGTYELEHHVNLVRKDAGEKARALLQSIGVKP